MQALNAELEVYVKVVECGSFNKAAEFLFLTPSAVVRQVKRLEEKTELSLLTRSSKGVLPTEAGVSLYRDAVEILRRWEDALARAHNIALHESRSIRIGKSALYPADALIALWADIDDSSKEFSLELVPFMETEDAGSHRALGVEYDILVGPTDATPLNGLVDMLELGSWEFCIAMPRDHRLVTREFLTLEDLEGERLMMIERGTSPTNDEIRNEILRRGISVAFLDAPRFYPVTVFNDCVRNNCLLISLDGWSHVHPDLVTVPLRPRYALPFGLMYAADCKPSVRAFIDCVSRHLGA